MRAISATCPGNDGISHDTLRERLTMSTDILMPALSPTMEEGVPQAKWFIGAGDTVRSGDVVAKSD